MTVSKRFQKKIRSYVHLLSAQDKIDVLHQELMSRLMNEPENKLITGGFYLFLNKEGEVIVRKIEQRKGFDQIVLPLKELKEGEKNV